jgi:hypothetical protein
MLTHLHTHSHLHSHSNSQTLKLTLTHCYLTHSDIYTQSLLHTITQKHTHLVIHCLSPLTLTLAYCQMQTHITPTFSLPHFYTHSNTHGHPCSLTHTSSGMLSHSQPQRPFFCGLAGTDLTGSQPTEGHRGHTWEIFKHSVLLSSSASKQRTPGSCP